MAGRTGASGGSIATSTNAATLFKVDVRDCRHLMFKVKPATKKLTALSVEVKVNRGDAEWAVDPIANTTAHFTAPTGAVFGASRDLTTLAAGTEGWAIIEIAGFSDLRVRVTADGVGTCAFSFNAH